MSEVAFHVNAPDRQGYVCRLLRKAYLKGSRVKVLVAPGEMAALDQALWTFAQGEFVPHARASDAPPVRARSPILITEELAGSEPIHDVLVNLSGQVPVAYTRFARVIEVVTQDQADRAGARERWKRYRDDGHTPVKFDLATSAA